MEKLFDIYIVPEFGKHDQEKKIYFYYFFNLS